HPRCTRRDPLATRAADADGKFAGGVAWHGRGPVDGGLGPWFAHSRHERAAVSLTLLGGFHDRRASSRLYHRRDFAGDAGFGFSSSISERPGQRGGYDERRRSRQY